MRKPNAYLGRSETFCRGFQTAINLPNWGRVCNPRQQHALDIYL